MTEGRNINLSRGEIVPASFGAHIASYPMDVGVSCRGIMQPKHETYHSFRSSVEVLNTWRQHNRISLNSYKKNLMMESIYLGFFLSVKGI
jgi:hypothetical protein